MFYETRKKGDRLIDEYSIKKYSPCAHSHITCYGGGVKKKNMQQDSEKKNLFEENLYLKKAVMEMKVDIVALKELDINALKELIVQTIKEYDAAKS
ncbi:hypothetical protein AXF42_Ash012736 [Apostasia shenzhenica]|uniref:Uncharacterized protein n=1 Tax=Apostasia shenzhenica TaxID=1088818 RepID=A0A2I0AMB8_9ASPA|nr:hypothetical protein AXF42_Ash012736 [Apostasia shenzhenica]